jgi:mannitol/fructose-specific phosphotransferase system IIA component (Ntr-type)
MLQEIAGVLQNPSLIESLMSANDFEEVRAAFLQDQS